MSNNKYTKFPSVPEGDVTNSGNVTYDGPPLTNSGISDGDLNEILKALDNALAEIGLTVTLDADAITNNNVTFSATIPSATNATNLFDQLIARDTVNTAKYTTSEVDALVTKNVQDYNLVSTPTPTVILDDVRDNPRIITLTCGSAVALSASIGVSGTPTSNDWVDFLLNFTAIGATSTISIFGQSVPSQFMQVGQAFIRMFYIGGSWKMIIVPDFQGSDIILTGQIVDFEDDVKAITEVANAITKTGFLTVTGAIDLDQMAVDVVANTAKNSYPSADAAKLAGIETSADVTDATNVAAAGALMKTGTQAGTAAYDFTGGTLEVAEPTTDTHATTKNYVDTKFGLVQGSKTMKAAEVYTLNSGVQLLPAPGVNSYYEIISLSCRLKWSSVAYTNVSNIEVEYAGGENIWIFDSTILSSTSDTITSGTAQSSFSMPLNTAVNLYTSLVPADGNSDVQIYFLYRIITVS